VTVDGPRIGCPLQKWSFVDHQAFRSRKTRYQYAGAELANPFPDARADLDRLVVQGRQCYIVSLRQECVEYYAARKNSHMPPHKPEASARENPIPSQMLRDGVSLFLARERAETIVVNLTISLDEPLASQLRREASAKQLSPEQAARDLLGLALGRIAEEEAWREINRRRGELINKNRHPGLTAEESQELDRLQAAVDQRLEPVDRSLLAAAEQFRQLAEALPDAASP
jgi:hypothetical protein